MWWARVHGVAKSRTRPSGFTHRIYLQAHNQIGSKSTFQRGVRSPPQVTQLEGKQPALQAEHLTLHLTMKVKRG